MADLMDWVIFHRVPLCLGVSFHLFGVFIYNELVHFEFHLLLAMYVIEFVQTDLLQFPKWMSLKIVIFVQTNLFTMPILFVLTVLSCFILLCVSPYQWILHFVELFVHISKHLERDFDHLDSFADQPR